MLHSSVSLPPHHPSFKHQFLSLGLQRYLIIKVKDFHESITKSYL